MSYDLMLNNDGDVDFVDGDVLTLRSHKLVAQDLQRRISIPQGALAWSPETGSGINQAINNNLSGQVIKRAMEDAALADPRIDAASVVVDDNNRLHYTLR